MQKTMQPIRLEKLPQPTTDKPTLLALRRRLNQGRSPRLSAQQIAVTAGVPLTIFFQAEIGFPISVEDARKILPAFCQLSGIALTLSDVSMQVRP